MATLLQVLERQGIPLKRIETIMAAYKPAELEAGVREHFKDRKDGSMKCRLCGGIANHPRAAQAHMAELHSKELDAMRAKGIQARDFSDEERKKLAKKGHALPYGGYPMVTRNDVENAVRAIGRAKNRAATIKLILKRAKALGAMDAVPEDWKKGREDASVDSAVTGVRVVSQPGGRGGGFRPSEPGGARRGWSPPSVNRISVPMR